MASSADIPETRSRAATCSLRAWASSSRVRSSSRSSLEELAVALLEHVGALVELLVAGEEPALERRRARRACWRASSSASRCRRSFSSLASRISSFCCVRASATIRPAFSWRGLHRLAGPAAPGEESEARPPPMAARRATATTTGLSMMCSRLPSGRGAAVGLSRNRRSPGRTQRPRGRRGPGAGVGSPGGGCIRWPAGTRPDCAQGTAGGREGQTTLPVRPAGSVLGERPAPSRGDGRVPHGCASHARVHARRAPVRPALACPNERSHPRAWESHFRALHAEKWRSRLAAGSVPPHEAFRWSSRRGLGTPTGASPCTRRAMARPRRFAAQGPRQRSRSRRPGNVTGSPAARRGGRAPDPRAGRHRCAAAGAAGRVAARRPIPRVRAAGTARARGRCPQDRPPGRASGSCAATPPRTGSARAIHSVTARPATSGSNPLRARSA